MYNGLCDFFLKSGALYILQLIFYMYLLCIMYLLFVFPFISQVLVENIKRKVEQSQFKWSNRAKIKPPQ